MAGRVELSPSTWQQPWPPVVDPKRSDVVGRIADRIQQLGDRRARVAVDGRTAGGKTMLAHELALYLSDAGRVVLRASLDDFKRPWAESRRYDRVTGDGYYRNAFDLEAIHELLLEPSATSGTGLVALCSVDPLTQIDHSATRVTMPPDGVLVIDGVFALRAELAAHWDLRIWVDIDVDLSLRRSTDRDAPRDGAERAEALHRERYGPAEEIYIAEAHPIERADIVVDNTDIDDPRIVRG
jgi:uridine kinase